LNDILSTAKKMMSSPLTMASWGDGMFSSFELSHGARQGMATNWIALIAVIHVPSYESVSRKFHSKWGFSIELAWPVPTTEGWSLQRPSAGI